MKIDINRMDEALKSESYSMPTGLSKEEMRKHIKDVARGGRLFSITDIHGCLSHLKSLVEKLKLLSTDTVVFLGDYVDRGEDSKGVIDYIISLRDVCNVITLVGNHDLMMLNSLTATDITERRDTSIMWLRNGGLKTLESYGLGAEALYSNDLPEEILEHLRFIENLEWWYETDKYIFVHATPKHDEHIFNQQEVNLVWRRPNKEDYGSEHISGKTIVSGHTAQADGLPLWISDKNLLTDTGCFFTGVLTAVEFMPDGITSFISVSSEDL